MGKPDLNVLASEGKIWAAIRRKLPSILGDMRMMLEKQTTEMREACLDHIARLLANAIEMEGDGRCTVMLPNKYGKERCGREFGHEGKCCYDEGGA